MKLKITENDFRIRPKQSEGKLVVGGDDHIVKPKSRGVQLFKNPKTFVVKCDRRSGVRMEKLKNSVVCKGSVILPPIDRYPQLHSNTQVWTNVADKPAGSEDSIAVGEETKFVTVESMNYTYYNIGTTVYGLENNNQAAVRWTGVIVDRESEYEMTVEITEVGGSLSQTDPQPQYWIITKEYLEV
jgi:hypothetical protein